MFLRPVHTLEASKVQPRTTYNSHTYSSVYLENRQNVELTKRSVPKPTRIMHPTSHVWSHSLSTWLHLTSVAAKLHYGSAWIQYTKAIDRKVLKIRMPSPNPPIVGAMKPNFLQGHGLKNLNLPLLPFNKVPLHKLGSTFKANYVGPKSRPTFLLKHVPCC